MIHSSKSKFKLVVDNYPTTAWFALTGKCNIKCAHCPAIREAENNNDVSENIYVIFTENILPKLNNVILGANNYGEQTLSKKIYDFIEESYKCSVKVKIWTNGTLLNDKLIQKIIETKTDVTISMEGIDENYEKIRKTSYNKIRHNIINLFNKKNEFDSDIKIEVAYTVYKGNLNDIYKLVDFGFDAININYLLPVNEVWEKVTFTQNERLELEDTFFKELIEYANGKGVIINHKITVSDINATGSNLLCNDPWIKVNIRENGDVLPCCIAGDDMILGNLNNSSFEEIWNGKKYLKLRQSIIDKKLIGTCRKCKGQYEESFPDKAKQKIKHILVTMKMYKLLNLLVETNRSFRRRF